MNIQIKNIKTYKALSEETTCFTADVFVGGKKIAYAKNDGHGGSTDYRTYKVEDRPILKAAEDFAKTLPDITNGDLKIKSTLENLIEQAVDDFENGKFRKKMDKLMETSILFGKANGYSYKSTGFMGKPKLKSLPASEVQRLIDSVKKELKEGEVILNTNLADLQVTL